MTINKLHKQLTSLIAKGYGRREVCVDKSKVTHTLESDGVCIIPVTSANIEVNEMMDEDGGHKTLSNGCVVTRMSLVIKAEC